MFDRLKNFIERRFLNKFYSRKIISIGHSHLLNFRQKYSSISSLSEVDYKIFDRIAWSWYWDERIHAFPICLFNHDVEIPEWTTKFTL